MKLKVLSLSDCEQVRQWRNEQLDSLRTSFILTLEQQVRFYNEIICNRQANARYWGIWEEVKTKATECCMDDDVVRFGREKEIEVFKLIGMCGLENIQLENRNAEISLIFNPEYPMDKYGEEALILLLHEGFLNINLENICAEIYLCNPYYEFWMEQVYKYKCKTATLPKRKYLNGKYYDGVYINFNKGAYNVKNENTITESAGQFD
ncbi:MAG TPA: GNAT family N-acetyltransferase [Ignavibacteriaceae bacterium]|nr:GNAT family N-acetyltransferase [Ignavibacteriaceae bacterium]